MPRVSRASLYRRRRRSSQPAFAGSDHDLELKSISCEPSTEEEEEEESEEEEEKEEEEEEEEEKEEEEEEEEEEELAPESSMEEEKEDFEQHCRNWEITWGKGRVSFKTVTSLSPMLFTHCSPSRISLDAYRFEEAEESEEEEEEDDDEEELAPEYSMEEEKEDFEQHRKYWEYTWGKGRVSFETVTSLSPMLFTHCSPSRISLGAYPTSTVQIYSIKIAKIKHLKWPLEVYGVVAARDFVDHKRNILFFRDRIRSQTVTKKDPYLHLAGPCRALMGDDPVHLEFQLKVKGQSPSEDRTLITRRKQIYNPTWHDWNYIDLSNYLCKIQLCFEQLQRSLQATILSVRVTQGSPFKYGGQIVCRASPCEDDPNKEIVLFDSNYRTQGMDTDETMCMDSDGYLTLLRRVVSVQGRLKVYIYTYSRSGAIAASGRVLFKAKDCQTSQATCVLHSCKPSKGKKISSSKGKDSKVKITVAWSRLARNIDVIDHSFFGDPLIGFSSI